MNIAYLTGAYQNAGDFLIEERAKSIIRDVCQNVNINRFYRDRIYNDIESINKFDAVVFGGGPLYMQDLNNYLNLDVCINEITPPIMIMGAGWYGANGAHCTIHDYNYSKQTTRFFQKVEEKGLGHSCRDICTLKTLKSAGFSNARMTGCPAWYCLKYMDKTTLRKDLSNINRIIVSDPALNSNINLFVSLLYHLRKKFKDAEIIIAFHRGVDKLRKIDKLHTCISDIEATIQDLSGTFESFSVYDNCDMHIGFRVHAHIYNLSIRNLSILIEEDGRGAGVNEALGLPSIKAYDDVINYAQHSFHHLYRRICKNDVRGFLNDLDTYIQLLETTDYRYIENAFAMQKTYYNEMRNFVNRLNNI